MLLLLMFLFPDVALQSVVEDEHRRQQRSRSSSVDLFDIRPGDNRASNRGMYMEKGGEKMGSDYRTCML